MNEPSKKSESPLARLASIKNTGVKQMISSSCGALITSLLMTPLDVVKIRLQAQNRVFHQGDCFVYRNGLEDHLCKCSNGPNSWYNRKIPGGRYHGTLDAMAKIVRAEGLGSLWSGLPPTLLQSFPQVVLYFTTYEQIKHLVGYHEINNPNPILPTISGGIARVIAVTAVSPIELVRTKIQSERLQYNELAKSIRLAIETQGLKSLYQGWVSTIWRDVPFSMIYWFNYEKLKTLMLDFKKVDRLDSISTFICGASAGSLSAAITCPFDVVKTHRQIQIGEKVSANAQKTSAVMRQIYRTKGLRGLFAGLTPRVTKVALSCAIMITTFEYFKKVFAV